MIVTLMKPDRIFSQTLPEKVKGRYFITDIGPDEKRRQVLSVEGINNKWQLKGDKRVKSQVLDVKDKDDVSLEAQVFYKVKIGEEEDVFLYAENITNGRQTFKKLIVRDNTEITVGRAGNNTIKIENIYVSANHARLNYFDGKWTISDLDSTNGTFVNDYRISTYSLKPGDIVFIMGFKIIIGSNFIGINNPDNLVEYDTNVLLGFAKQSISTEEANEDIIIEDQYFYRSPRFKRSITPQEIKVDAPPQAEKLDTIPTALMIGPSVTMGMASMSTGVFTVINTISTGGKMVSAMPTLIMSMSMLLGMILWPVLTKKYEKKQKSKLERIRQARYKNYLFSIKDTILKEEKIQSDILFENNVSIDECASRIVEKKRNLWERMLGQDDFLQIRVGLGNLPFVGKIQYPDKKFSLEDDNLLDDLYVLKNEPKQLNMVPVTYSFIESCISGIIGENKKIVADFVKGLIIRIAALHSYDELKIVIIADENNKEQWEVLKWLPHMWDNDKNVRYFCTNIGEAKEISSYLEKEFYERSSNKTEAIAAPYYLIVNTSRNIAEKIDIVEMMLKSKTNFGFSIINVDNSINNLPKESSMVIEIDERISKIYDKNDISGRQTEFVADIGIGNELSEVVKAAANIKMDIADQTYSLPNVITFLEMFGVNKIEHINPLMRWKENNPTISLAAPIGVDTMGELFYLDLHEKFQGPHGLVAGMTGSGKSEFIITYILSMAANYHPDEVAFILIDYKGGGLTGAFEDEEKGIKLPHLAGTITNLDGAAVKRSLISIQSELRRRQAIFNNARRVSNEGTMDIYKYQKLYRDKVVTEPVPHLFIISDEFAELKSQQPEFMEQLISTARIGRSLGVHLILATQKPSGVVDDQIWSNSRFRVCLKVQDKADSNDMIKRPDAAELSNTGRFYLQVGFNEFFALGQSAWCGAPYNEDGISDKNVDNSIKVIDSIGRVVKEVKPPKKEGTGKQRQKQIVAMVKYLSDLAKEENISVRPLWLNPIPAMIYPEKLIEKYNIKNGAAHELNPVIGELDDPFNQNQEILTLPFSSSGNILVYGVAGAGKLTMLTTMVYELIRLHSAEYLNIYILDFGAETLRMFEKAPQVGDVIFSSEGEKIINLMKMIKAEISVRKKLFVDYGGDYESYIKNSRKACPNIIVIINNYSAFAEAYEDCEEVISYVSREGTKYGIYFVVTATNTGSVRYRIVQNFKSIFVLQMNDKTDYSAILGPTEGTFPSPIKGRGIVKREHTYEIQIASVADEENVLPKVKELIDSILAGYTGPLARRVPILPEKVDSTYLEDKEVSIDKFPMGVDKRKLSVIYHNIKATYITFVLSQDYDGISTYLQGFAENAHLRSIADLVVIDAINKFIPDDNRQYNYINDKLEEAVVSLFNEMVRRHKLFKEQGSLENEKQIVYVINSIDTLFSSLSEDGADKLRVLIEKGKAEYKICFVIGDTAAAITKHSFEEWYKVHCAVNSGVWIGDGVSDQYILKINKISSELYKEVGSQSGMYISKGKYTIIKLLTSYLYNVEEE